MKKKIPDCLQIGKGTVDKPNGFRIHRKHVGKEMDMDDVFQAAVDSLLSLFGSDAELVAGGRRIEVRCSPLFSSKLRNGKTGAKVADFSANVIVAGKGMELPEIFPGKTILELKGETYRIHGVFKIDSAGSAIAYELELRK